MAYPSIFIFLSLNVDALPFSSDSIVVEWRLWKHGETVCCVNGTSGKNGVMRFDLTACETKL
jgi:hypothetical protein